MNALMRLNQLKPGLQYKLISQTGPVHAPIFTMSVEVDGSTFEASGPSKKTAKLHVAVKVSVVTPFLTENATLASGFAGLRRASQKGYKIKIQVVRLLDHLTSYIYHTFKDNLRN